MNQWTRIFNLRVYFLLAIPFLIAGPSGSSSNSRIVSEYGFNGTLTMHSDGRLELSMKDGSDIFIGPGAKVETRTIGKTAQLSLRLDKLGRVIFAADRQLVMIYTFRYKYDDSCVFMTDPQAMVSGYWFDGTTGKVKEVLLPSRKRIRFP